MSPKLGSVKSVLIRWDLPELELAVIKHLNDGNSQNISFFAGVKLFSYFWLVASADYMYNF